jgi:CubicO group peptidase (beta-lactamase class C family)
MTPSATRPVLFPENNGGIDVIRTPRSLLLTIGVVWFSLGQLAKAAPSNLEHPNTVSQSELRSLEDYVQGAMSYWGVAGAAVAIVKDGQTVFLRGFGLRDVRNKLPVDENTIFGIGSMSKPLTSIAIGTLIDEGRLHLEDKIVALVPGFGMADPYVTGETTFRDAMSHRTGCDWQIDPLLFFASSTRIEVIKRLEGVRPHFSFRSQYAYCNIMYMIAGEAAGNLGGSGWDQLIRDRLFGPLGMSSSDTNLEASRKKEDLATPHTNNGTGPQPVPWLNLDITGGAGAITSTARDMAQVLMLLSDRGQYAGRTVLKERTLDELLAPVVDMGVDNELTPFVNFHFYALGFEVMDYKGRKVAMHGGVVRGMLSQMAVVPEESLGVVVLTNTDGVRGLPDAIALHILDAYLGGKNPDWISIQHEKGLPLQKLLSEVPMRIAHSQPTLPMGDYVGDYQGTLGTVRIGLEKGLLVETFGSLTTVLHHWHYDSFRSDWGVYGQRMTTFSLNSSGKPQSLEIDLVGIFERVPAQDQGPSKR